jgi:voltage-gated potassium channel
MSSAVRKRFIWSGVVIVAVLVTGTFGYWLIGGRQYSLLDTLYMTVITIATIGYYEVVDLSHNPVGRIFTMVIAVLGIGTFAYIFTNLTALVVEGELSKSFRRRRMEKIIRNSKDHYMVCGIGKVGFYIVEELRATRRPHVIVDMNKSNIEAALETFKDGAFVEGDATDPSVLLEAGIERAKGIFAVTGDDNQNLVIILTAKQLRPAIRAVARCNEIRNAERMKKAGADAVISPTYIGGLRLVSEMIRPTAVSFLDAMLRDKELNLRVEEVCVPESFVGRTVSSLNFRKYPNSLLLAIKTAEGWIYNPRDDCIIGRGNTLIVMATPEARYELETIFSSEPSQP